MPDKDFKNWARKNCLFAIKNPKGIPRRQAIRTEQKAWIMVNNVVLIKKNGELSVNVSVLDHKGENEKNTT